MDSVLIQYLKIIELVTVIIFTIEYILRFYTANKKIDYFLSFYGIVDLIAILPFYLTLGIDLRSIRVIRLLRLTKLLRYNTSLSVLKDAFIRIKSELIIFTFTSVILIYISSIGIYYFENTAQPEAFKSIFHCMWWAVCTLTTVGYGDIYPITVGGKIFTSIISLLGIGIIAIPTGLLASSLSSSVKS